jgi:elongation factor G
VSREPCGIFNRPDTLAQSLKETESMQVESPQRIRNVAVTGHNDTGKTTTVSALLYASGATPRLLKVDDGNTLTDFDHQEVERGISIGMAPAFAAWKGHKVNLLDCPGYGIFFTETRAGMRAADTALLAINAVAGVEVNTERVWQTAQEMDLPVMFHLTKMDRERADFERVVGELEERFGREVMPVQVPIGKEDGFEGVVDLVRGKAIRYEKDGDAKGKEEDVPEDLKEKVSEWRDRLMETVAESDWTASPPLWTSMPVSWRRFPHREETRSRCCSSPSGTDRFKRGS